MPTAADAPPEFTPAGVMNALRASTAPDHALAEGHPLQRSLAQGAVSPCVYAAYLGELCRVHQALEVALEALAASDARLRPVLTPVSRRSGDISRDLLYLGASPPTEPMPATTALIAEITRAARSDPLSVLGMHYVLEGSKNGGRYIARSIRRGLSLPPNEGTWYLDPHGEDQRNRWLAFKSAMDAISLSDEEINAAVRGARAMFRSIAAISDELSSCAPV